MQNEDFPLSTLGERLSAFRSDLISGRGFVLIRGLPIEKYSELERTAIFFGMGTYVGHARSQNAAGHVLGHVRDLGKNAADPNTRIYQTKERQTIGKNLISIVSVSIILPVSHLIRIWKMVVNYL